MTDTAFEITVWVAPGADYEVLDGLFGRIADIVHSELDLECFIVMHPADDEDDAAGRQERAVDELAAKFKRQRHALDSYNRLTTKPCPRCGSPELGLPYCTDAGWECHETCQYYTWANDVCAACGGDVAAQERAEDPVAASRVDKGF